jgi:hypothetical protein
MFVALEAMVNARTATHTAAFSDTNAQLFDTALDIFEGSISTAGTTTVSNAVRDAMLLAADQWTNNYNFASRRND